MIAIDLSLASVCSGRIGYYWIIFIALGFMIVFTSAMNALVKSL
jgi:hypothetical protein